MKKNRRLALWFLMTALMAILAVGFFLAAAHQEARPTDSGSPQAR